MGQLYKHIDLEATPADEDLEKLERLMDKGRRVESPQNTSSKILPEEEWRTLKWPVPPIKNSRGYYRWYKKHRDFISRWWDVVPTPAFLEMWQLSKSAMSAQIRRMRAEGHHVPKKDDGRFQKGIPAWNKGKKGLQIGGKETRFKKGQVPPNKKDPGTIRLNVEGYAEIKIEGKKWERYARYLYDKYIGPIPKGMLVTHRDGNIKNHRLANLQLISRAENAKRNMLTDMAIARKLARKTGHGRKFVVDEEYKMWLLTTPEGNDIIKMKRRQLLINQKLKDKINGKSGTHTASE